MFSFSDPTAQQHTRLRALADTGSEDSELVRRLRSCLAALRADCITREMAHLMQIPGFVGSALEQEYAAYRADHPDDTPVNEPSAAHEEPAPNPFMVKATFLANVKGEDEELRDEEIALLELALELPNAGPVTQKNLERIWGILEYLAAYLNEKPPEVQANPYLRIALVWIAINGFPHINLPREFDSLLDVPADVWAMTDAHLTRSLGSTSDDAMQTELFRETLFATAFPDDNPRPRTVRNAILGALQAALRARSPAEGYRS